jgi:predicted amidophosphoribosyltransferase
MEKAFSLKKSKVQTIVGKNILLLDDVVSTGSTFNACAKVLKE